MPFTLHSNILCAAQVMPGAGYGVDDGEGGIGCPLEGMVLSSPKRKSTWLQEREQIMAEWGAFAISGLVLAGA